MIYLLFFVLCLNTSTDTSIQQADVVNPRNYTKQVLINGLVGIGFAVGTGVFYIMGEDAHDHYKESDSIRTALDNWDKMKVYDNLRNACAIGALVFTVRAVYYQLKNVKASKSTKYKPTLDIKYAYQNKWSLGIKTVF